MSTWWIDEPRLLGSSNPDEAEVERLRAAGFDALVCLLDTGEQPPAYAVPDVEKQGWRWMSIPVRDFTAPTVEQLTAFVGFVDELPTDSRAVVHCQGGTGRTGTFAAAYLIAKGLTAEAAISAVRAKRPGAVETSDQRAVLLEFEGQSRPND
jgi:atypical dual specificity phosphatase